MTQCLFITAHECPDKPGTQVDWRQIAKLKNTSLIIYMGASRIEAISQKLIKYGMDPAMPAAAIENGTLPKQRTLTSRLDTIASEFDRQNFKAPVIIMVSPAIDLKKDIAWYENKPLFNKRIAVAGGEERIEALSNLIYDLGGEMFPLKILKTQLNIPGINLKDFFDEDHFDWILFTCKSGVKYFWELLDERRFGYENIRGKKIAALGPGTTNALNSLGLNPDYSSEEFSADSFRDDFLYNCKLAGEILLRIPDTSLVDKISDELNKSGIKSYSLKVFDNLPNQPVPEIIAELKKKSPDIFIFTCQSSIDYFFNILGSETAAAILKNCGSILFDPVTQDALVKHNSGVKNISS